ncbi:MAG TPA: hypothetical protein VFK29_07315 [Rhodanobacteraceae bacterium]|jgi:hypothetical protein|nr:hypothetical protein [Rhodanobacteraceae bacterium]
MRQAALVALSFALATLASAAFAASPQTAAQAAASTPMPGASAPEAPASMPATAGSSGPASSLSPADQKRFAAIRQYQHDLVTVVALRAEPDYLLGAAILARPFGDSSAGLDFDGLSARAAAAPGAGPAQHWVRLVACKGEEDCPNRDALAWLEKHAADNAAVWIVAMDVAARKDDAEAERAALHKAAAAKVYDDYYGKALAATATAVAVLPPLPDTMTGAHDGQPDNPEGVRVLVSVNATQASPRPDLEPVVKSCAPDAVGKHQDTREACLKLTHTLQWGSSPVARAAGLHIQAQLEAGAGTANQQSARDLAWQVRQYSALLQRSLTDPTQASRWLTAARNGGTELSLILATLRANNVPLNAPADEAAAPASAGSANP